MSGKGNEAKSLTYRTHHIIDADSRVILDPHVTTGAVMEVGMALERVDFVRDAFGLKIDEAIADRGYGSFENLNDFENRGIETNIPLWSTRSGQAMFRDLERGFTIPSETRIPVCPVGHEMRFRGRDNRNNRQQFQMPKTICSACPLKLQCMPESVGMEKAKKFWVSDYYDVVIRTNEKQKEPVFKKKLWERMWKMEGIFAEAKFTMASDAPVTVGAQKCRSKFT